MKRAYERAVRLLLATSLSALPACAPCAAQGEDDGNINRERAENLQQAGPGIPGWD